ncbi:hypothetical protein X963_6208 [Burkholderia pseudomallei MSHR7498]|nr:hypothetical protein X976_6133 [Burkholderia pseudomallei MSHR7500]KGS96383.1 hypothetical protein X963_6208 [Burkholderia pseudomallei MSHR7498]KGX63355.1 hypothetical protein Y027_6320 [Burkholderia pseudomallei TSV5]
MAAADSIEPSDRLGTMRQLCDCSSTGRPRLNACLCGSMPAPGSSVVATSFHLNFAYWLPSATFFVTSSGRINPATSACPGTCPPFRTSPPYRSGSYAGFSCSPLMKRMSLRLNDACSAMFLPDSTKVPSIVPSVSGPGVNR